MKGNKKLLVVAVLVLLTVVFSTYAVYRTNQASSATVRAANWVIDFGTAQQKTKNFVFNTSDITWTTNPGKNGTIAPGATGYIEIPVTATGTEVDVIVEATVTGNDIPEGISATVQNGSQTITYGATMAATVRINIAWEGSYEDDGEKDSSDLTVKNSEITIPVTITAKQALS